MLRDDRGITRRQRLGGRHGWEGKRSGVDGRRERRIEGNLYRNERRKEEEGWRVVFWNVVGLSNKDNEFWEGLKNWDVTVSETWWRK